MIAISIYYPEKLVFGPGALKQAMDDYSSSLKQRVYILSIEAVLELISPQLKELRTKGLKIKTNVSLKAEPTFADFERLKEEVREFKPDSIAGIGGGSVMDVAKLLAVFANFDEALFKYVGIGLLTQRKTHLICIPTTSGTGSEVSPNSILLDESDGAKKGIISPFLVPDAAYVDPELSLGLSREITAYTGIDALTHCVEAYANKNAHPLIDHYALKGISLITHNLKNACDEIDNLEARTQLALGSLYGGICLGPVNTAAVHALAYPLGSMFKIPHGLSNAVLLPHVMKFNIPGSEERYAEISKNMGIEDSSDQKDLANKSVIRIKQLLSECGIPSRLRDIGIDSVSIEEMANSAIQVQRLLKNNLKEVLLDDAIQIYKNAY